MNGSAHTRSIRVKYVRSIHSIYLAFFMRQYCCGWKKIIQKYGNITMIMDFYSSRIGSRCIENTDNGAVVFLCWYKPKKKQQQHTIGPLNNMMLRQLGTAQSEHAAVLLVDGPFCRHQTKPKRKREREEDWMPVWPPARPLRLQSE